MLSKLLLSKRAASPKAGETPFSFDLTRIVRTGFLEGSHCCDQLEECSFLDNEPFRKQETYAGKRVKRGLFRASDGRLINADVNGSGNIIWGRGRGSSASALLRINESKRSMECSAFRNYTLLWYGHVLSFVMRSPILFHRHVSLLFEAFGAMECFFGWCYGKAVYLCGKLLPSASPAA